MPVGKIQPEQTPDETFTYFDIGSIDNERNLITQPKEVTGRTAPSRARQVVQEGDILFSTVRTYLRNIAMVDKPFPNPVASTGLVVLRPAAGVLGEFMLYQLLSTSFLTPLNLLQSGSSYPAVREKDVRAQPFLLPPTAEQQRIVLLARKKLKSLSKAVDASVRAQSRIRNFKEDLLDAAVTGKLTESWRRAHVRLAATRSPTNQNGHPIPSTWSWASLSEAVPTDRPIVYGIIKPGPHDPAGVPYVRVTEMKDGWIDVKTLRRASRNRERLFQRARLHGGDILISKDGTIGRVAVVPEELHGGNITQHIVRVSLRETFVRDYIVLALRAPSTQRWLASETKGVAQQGVNVADFRRLPVPIPPFEEQEQIVAVVHKKLKAADALEEVLTRQQTKAKQAKEDLLQQAVKGTLVAQSDKDEPAGNLLRRVSQARLVPATTRSTRITSQPSVTMPKHIIKLSLLEVLQKQKRPVTPEQLLQEAGYAVDEVDAFYRQLNVIRDKIVEHRPSNKLTFDWPGKSQITLTLKRKP